MKQLRGGGGSYTSQCTNHTFVKGCQKNYVLSKLLEIIPEASGTVLEGSEAPRSESHVIELCKCTCCDCWSIFRYNTFGSIGDEELADLSKSLCLVV